MKQKLIALEVLSFVFIASAMAADGTAPSGSNILIVSDSCASGDPLCVEKKFIEAGKVLPRATGTKPVAAPAAVPGSSASAPRAHVAQAPSLAKNPLEKPVGLPTPPTPGVKTQITPGGYGYTFEEDGVSGKGMTPKDFIAAAGPRAKIILSDELECQLPQEVTDSYGFDRARCVKLKAPVVESGRVLGSQLAAEFARTGECPKDFNDIEKLKTLEAEYEKAPFEVDPSSLIAAPLDISSPAMEAHLPFSCGYNSFDKKWYQKVAIHFDRPGFAYDQGAAEFPKNSGAWVAAGGPGSTFRMVGKALGDGRTSYRVGGDIGDIRLIPLSQGVFVKVVFNPTGTFYWGLVFAPSAGRFQQQACKKARWLEKHADLATAADRAASQTEIRKLLMRADALQRVKQITQMLKDTDKDDMPETMRTRLTADARELLLVVEGKSEIKDFTFGTLNCPEND